MGRSCFFALLHSLQHGTTLPLVVLPPRETGLAVWQDNLSGLAYISRIRRPLLNEKTVPYLHILAAVNTSELLDGLR